VAAAAGDTTMSVTDDGDIDQTDVPAVTVEDVLDESDVSEDESRLTSTHLPREHRNTTTTSQLCGSSQCETGRGNCQLMRNGPLCLCVNGYYGPDCQQRKQ